MRTYILSLVMAFFIFGCNSSSETQDENNISSVTSTTVDETNEQLSQSDSTATKETTNEVDETLKEESSEESTEDSVVQEIEVDVLPTTNVDTTQTIESTTVEENIDSNDITDKKTDESTTSVVDHTNSVDSNSSTLEEKKEDSTNSSNNDNEVTPASKELTNIEKALLEGDASYLSSSKEVIEEVLVEIASIQTTNSEFFNSIYQDEAIAYNAGKNSQYIYSNDMTQNYPLLIGNKGKSLAVAGENETSRYAAYGERMYKQAAYTQATDNLMKWLTRDSDTLHVKNIAISYMKSSAKEWIKTTYPSWVIHECNDVATLNSCYNLMDVVIVGGGLGNDSTDASALANAIETAMTNATSILYIHDRLYAEVVSSSAVLAKMNMYLGGYGGNYFKQDAASYSNVSSMLNSSVLDTVESFIKHFEKDDFSVDFTACKDASCKSDSFVEQVSKAITVVYGFTHSYDKTNTNIFKKGGRRLEKLLILLADEFRKTIHYPMKKNVTNQREFFAAYFADKAIYNSREYNAAQNDLGTFSEPITNSIKGSNYTKTFEVNAKGGFSSLGYYALPGETVTMKRNDTNPLNATVFINSMRTGSSRTFNVYNRPTNIKSERMSIKAGESITFTSPIGGIIYVNTSSAASTSTMNFSVQNVGKHLVYEKGMSAATFASKLASTPYSWVEVKTPYIQIHSQKVNIQKSIDDARYKGDIDTFLLELQKYMVEDTYNLAGFSDDTLSLNSNVLAVCSAKGLSCSDKIMHALPKIQHINSDFYSHCGTGCSGNPYDQAGPVRPKGWGETHEIGHNLQRSHLKIYGGLSAEVTNQIFPIHKLITMNAEVNLGSSRSMNDKELFTMMQNAVNDANPVDTAYSYIWENSSYAANNRERISFLMQVVYQNDINPAFSNGWDSYTLLYLLDREFSHVSSADWASKKDSLGFSNYDTKPKINGNDFFLVALSYVSSKDFRALFDIFGITYSDEASAQVNAYGYPKVAKEFYIRDDENVFESPTQVLPIDGTQVWPL